MEMFLSRRCMTVLQTCWEGSWMQNIPNQFRDIKYRFCIGQTALVGGGCFRLSFVFPHFTSQFLYTFFHYMTIFLFSLFFFLIIQINQYPRILHSCCFWTFFDATEPIQTNKLNMAVIHFRHKGQLAWSSWFLCLLTFQSPHM